MKIGLIDLGTNSIKLIIAEIYDDGRFSVMYEDRIVARIGHDVFRKRKIDDDGIRKSVTGILTFKRVCDQFGCDHIQAFATSALREADNREMVCNHITADTGVPVEIISGQEEARLIHTAVVNTESFTGQPILIADVGGGSTEFILGVDRQINSCISIPIGALRVKEWLPDKDRFSEKELRLFEKRVEREMSYHLSSLRSMSFSKLVLTGGTSTSLSSVVQKITDQKTIAWPYEIALKDVQNAIIKLNDRSTEKRAKEFGLEKERADIMIPGAIILKVILSKLKKNTAIVSRTGLKFGLLHDRVLRTTPQLSLLSKHHARETAIAQMAKKYDIDERHSIQVAKLCNQLFTDLIPIHHYGEEERSLLYAAARLHDVGQFVDPQRHHKHSFYILYHSPMMGLSSKEKEIVAHLARYHRKGMPSLKHEYFCDLNDSEQDLVRKLGGILRLADGLDRGHASIVKRVYAQVVDTVCTLKIYTDGNFELESWMLPEKSDLLEKALGLTVHTEEISNE